MSHVHPSVSEDITWPPRDEFSFEKFKRDYGMFYVYVLQSLKDKSLYIGSTSNLQRRLKQHNSGKSRYTNQHRPYKFICYIALPLRSDAERFEEYLKSGYGRRTLRKMLKDYFSKDQKREKPPT